MNNSTVQVTNIENRGGKDVAYGFVYFSDDTRVAYTSMDGVEQDVTGGWEPVTDQHVTLAEQSLREKGLIPA